ncbi:unnamed protein product, partial [Rotaria sordida]
MNSNRSIKSNTSLSSRISPNFQMSRSDNSTDYSLSPSLSISNNRSSFSTTRSDALEYVFDLFDFDDNKQLDRNEYNLWTIRTTGEEINDDDWSSIREHVGLDIDENVSKEKFLKLNDFN